MNMKKLITTAFLIALANVSYGQDVETINPVDLQPYIKSKVEYPASELFYAQLANLMGCPIENMQTYWYPAANPSQHRGDGFPVTVKCDNRDPREYSCIFNPTGGLICLNDQGLPEGYAQIVRNNSR